MKIRALFVAVMFSAAALLVLSLSPRVVSGQSCGTGMTPFQPIGTYSQFGPYTYLDIDVNQGGVMWATGSAGLVTISYCQSPFVVGFAPNGQHPQTVASAPDGSAWVTTTGNQIYHVPAPVNCSIPTWQLYPGAAKDIAVTSNGTVWVIGTNSTGGGYYIYYWNGSSWVSVEGGATRIAAAPAGAINDNGQPWVVNTYQQILHRLPNGGWQGYPGNAYDIGLDRYTGNPWVVGTLSDGSGFELFYWNGSAWIGNKTGTGGINIATGTYSCTPNATFIGGDGKVHSVSLTP
jgi:hypothetical protein